MKEYFKIGLAALLIILVITGSLAIYLNYSGMSKTNCSSKEQIETMKQMGQLSCQSGILVDGKGHIIYEKNKDAKSYPASTTKILTVMLALEIAEEIGSDIDHLVKVPKEAVGIEGSSIYLKEGQQVTFRDLLYGSMLRSGNDGATALAIIAGGDLNGFIDRMNQRAIELGCKGSHFTNPTGLFDENHYTTPYDMWLIAREAMKNPVFREIAQTKKWQTQSESLKGQIFVNKNKTIFRYKGGTGIKIGYTQEAGRTLVASAQRGNEEMFAIVFKDSNWFEDCYRLMDYGFKIRGVEKDE